VLADGWSYPLWVVGATHMREVDEAWPAVGASLHHSVGSWPLLLEDTTEVTAVEPDRMIELTARAWPTGEARVRLTLEPVAGGTRVAMGERTVSGPARLIPPLVEQPLLAWRNRESLARLEAVAVHRR
jgi:hypothetical protein